MQTGFPEVKKKLGFGAMRLPMIGEKVDLAAFSKMVDLFLSEGFNYFDTAHPYLNGESELALREALTSRYPREAYLLANKLTAPYFDQESDIRFYNLFWGAKVTVQMRVLSAPTFFSIKK